MFIPVAAEVGGVGGVILLVTKKKRIVMSALGLI